MVALQSAGFVLRRRIDGLTSCALASVPRTLDAAGFGDGGFRFRGLLSVGWQSFGRTFLVDAGRFPDYTSSYNFARGHSSKVTPRVAASEKIGRCATERSEVSRPCQGTCLCSRMLLGRVSSTRFDYFEKWNLR
jgi:hypothetical protein